MRDYGKVHTSFWTSETTRGMSEDARALALYLLTCSHNTIAGVFRLPDGYVCDDIQWSPARVAKGFKELLSKGFANRCETTKWVWIRKHFEWNPPENPNQKKAAAKQINSVPSECCWKAEFIGICVKFVDSDSLIFENPSETVPQPFRNQDQDQEQKQEKRETTRFTRPTLAQVAEVMLEKGSPGEAEKFWNYYESNGWRVGKNPMKNWRAAIAQWLTRNFDTGKAGSAPVAQAQRFPIPS